MVSASYQLFMPTKVQCGSGLSQKTGEIIKPFVKNNVLLVTDKGVRAANLLVGIEKSLKDSNLDYEIFDEVEPNPSAEVVHSSIDTAKGIAAMANNDGNILDYEGVGVIPNPTLPLLPFTLSSLLLKT